MRHEDAFGEPAELAALYLAGALPAEERARFEGHLRTPCEQCRAEVEALAPAAAALADVVKPLAPDPRTREALLARAAAPRGRHPRAPAGRGDEAGRIVSRAAAAVWEPAAIPGVSVRTLFVDPARNQATALVRMEAGSSYPAHVHGGTEEFLVLEGDLRLGEEVLGPGDYQRWPAGSRHDVQNTERGCLVLITSSLTDVFE